MGEKRVIEALVAGGHATGGPPLGPALGPLGVNVMAVVNKINELTRDFSGIKVPVKITVDIDTKEFNVEVGTPPTTALVVRELKVEKGSGDPGKQRIGNLTLKQVIKITKVKRSELLAKTLKKAVKEVLGSCVSMGVAVEGKNPKEVQREIDEGVYDEIFREERPSPE